jgi:cellulose synthase/poly-beta-1,6-N-acetylglucosamine synthase-like glycosyltransferase
MKTLFFFLLFLTAYAYAIYPFSLRVLAGMFAHPWLRGDATPAVSVIICAYNEEDVIEQKINNALALDYPLELLEVMVGSDGSSDRTNQILNGLNHHCLTRHIFFKRAGKTECLNRMVPQAKGEVILFTDANSMFPPDLLCKMVRNFADPSVGLVSGWTKYHRGPEDEENISAYSRFEMALKVWESAVYSCVGADGAVFAIRKSCYRKLLPHDINDFVIPLNVIRGGLRSVLDPGVFCIEESARDERGEFRRQVRITTRTLGAIRRNLEFLNPLRYGIFSFFLISHKIMRFTTPAWMIALFAVNALLLGAGIFFAAIFSIQVLFAVLGGASLFLNFENRWMSLLRTLILTFAAQLAGWFRMLSGVEDTTWTPQRKCPRRR